MNTRKRSVGSSIDDFLKEEGIYEECVNMAVKAIIAEQMVSVMEEKRITKTELAKKNAHKQGFDTEIARSGE